MTTRGDIDFEPALDFTAWIHDHWQDMEQTLEIEDGGWINRNDAAYPTLVSLSDGALIAGFTMGGGPLATGGTYCSRSFDNGYTWEPPRLILPAGESPPTRNSLRLSLVSSGHILAYGMLADRTKGKLDFGKQTRRDPVLCRSGDGGRTWSKPEYLQTDPSGPFEISNPILELRDGTWLAPAATLHEEGRFGEKVIVFCSRDRGQSWPEVREVLKDGEGKMGFFEQKVISCGGDRLLAAAWTVAFPDYRDLENHFTVSVDGGRTWSPPTGTGVYGQTMSPLWLGDDRFLVLYNRRHGDQGVVAALVRLSGMQWIVESDKLIWEAPKREHGSPNASSGLSKLKTFEFGLPSAISLGNQTFLACFWCREGASYGVRWQRISIV